MACEAGIIPLVLGGDSIPLDLGRTARIASPHQRIALGEGRVVARVGCGFP
jgi:hypothetical protein